MSVPAARAYETLTVETRGLQAKKRLILAEVVCEAAIRENIAIVPRDRENWSA